ncbi:hypothetical protein [Chryseobacterium sp.]|uniref:hypothetical protein n=1 Tax=Chryseobacterium sp. TaxID=1871047 RepID=UPI00388F9289
MKTYFLIILLSISSLVVKAQVAIGKTSTSSPSASLEFGYTPNDVTKQRGIILPWTNASNTLINVVPGTMIFDSSDKKIKYYKGTDDPNSIATWVDLTINGDGTVDKSLQDNLTESAVAKVSIGEKTNTEGILVLEDNNKAMVLPMVDKYSSVVNPTAGMMVYDMANNMICFFNGTAWTFWKTSNT